MFDDLDIDWTAVGLSLALSTIPWYIMWKTQMWQDSVSYTTTKKIMLSAVVPIIGYFIVKWQLSK